MKLFSPVFICTSVLLHHFIFQDFITAGVTAYAIGCTDEGLRGELLNARDSNEPLLELASSGGGTGVKLKITSEEVRIFPHATFFSHRIP
jgi:hypothetical protein